MNKKDGSSMNTIYSFHQMYKEESVIKRLLYLELCFEDVQFLEDKKCDYLQGYYFSKLVEIELFEKLLKSQNYKI